MTTVPRNRHQDGFEESATVGRITAQRSEFLRFIAARVGEPAAAEDIPQVMKWNSNRRSVRASAMWLAT
jgi:hypothetical protein